MASIPPFSTRALPGWLIADLETAPPRTEPVGARRRDPHGVWLFTITAAVLAGVFITAWLLSSLGGNTAATLAAGLVSVVAFIIVVIAGRELADGQTFRTLSSLIVTVVACVAIVCASWNGVLLRLKVQGSEGAWSQAVLCALGKSGSGSCVDVQTGRLNLPSFGRVDEISFETSEVIFRGPNNASGLIYSPGSSTVGFDECVGHIGGPWWQYGGDGSGCPLGMHFAPGP
jgi:hypothetical protein